MAGCPEFNLTVTDNIKNVLERVCALMVKNGGTFSGDTTLGEFSGKTIVGMVHGKYEINENVVSIKIESKPMFLPCDQIKSVITGYFKYNEF